MLTSLLFRRKYVTFFFFLLQAQPYLFETMDGSNPDQGVHYGAHNASHGGYVDGYSGIESYDSQPQDQQYYTNSTQPLQNYDFSDPVYGGQGGSPARVNPLQNYFGGSMG